MIKKYAIFSALLASSLLVVACNDTAPTNTDAVGGPREINPNEKQK